MNYDTNFGTAILTQNSGPGVCTLNYILINPIKIGGGEGKTYQVDTKIYFLIGKHISNTTKLLDFLHFGLTNPMVPNLAHVLYWDGFERHFYEELTKRNWLFYGILTFLSKL